MSMANYHDIYLKCDVQLLVDFYDYDDVHYYTAPDLAWDAALKMSRASLELITDIDIPFHREKHSRWVLNDHQ